MQFSNIIWATLLALPLTYAQQSADGLIVPFTTQLPACASKCGPLFDVQGKCTPPNIATTDIACFCSDNRLRAINDDGTAGVTSVCGAASCTAASDLQAIQDWYKNFCLNKIVASTTVAGGAGSTSTSKASSKPSSSSGASGASGGGGNQSWLATHTKWVIMIVVIVVGIIVLWIGACLLRRRYIRKKEREIEMRPPVAWGPHQAQAASGGYTYGDGVVNAAGGRHAGAGGHHKEGAPANGTKVKKERKQRWFKPS